MGHLTLRSGAVLMAAAAMALMPMLAQAHGHRASVYVGFGPAYYGTYYYAPYPMYPVLPPRVLYPPPVVIESSPPLPQAATIEVRYFCSDPKGYYPEVPACPSGWAELPSVPPDFKPGAKKAKP